MSIARHTHGNVVTTPYLKESRTTGISQASGIEVFQREPAQAIGRLSQRLHTTTMWLTNASPIVIITGE